MSIFRTIKYLLCKSHNEEDITGVVDNSLTITVRSYNQAINVLGWLKENGVFKITRFETENIPKGVKVYVEYKDLDVDNDFFRYSGIRGRSRKVIEEDNNKGRDYKYYSTGDATDAYMYQDEERYEKITYEDRVNSDFASQMLGYENFRDFIRKVGDWDVFLQKLQELDEQTEKEYRCGEEDEYEEAEV